MEVCYIAGYYGHSLDGIGRYTRNLLKEIKNIDKDLTYSLIAEGKSHSNVKTTSHTVKKSKPLFPPFVHSLARPVLMEQHYFARFYKTSFSWAQQIKNIQADIFHAISPSESVGPVRAGKKPLVTTVHDIIPLIFKPRFLMEKLYFTYYLNNTKHSDAIIADSISTKNDLVSLLNFPKDKIVVVYPGIDTKKFHPHLSKKGQIKKVLYLGGLVERKGISETVLAFAQVVKKRTDVRLQIGGGHVPETVRQLIKKHQIEQYVDFLGFVDESELAHLYSSADVFVYPSKYEGFGYTPLEAMACGIPVITSNTSSIPEVVQDAALTVDPTNIDALASKIAILLSDVALQTKLSSAGPRVAKQYTLERCAKETLEVYNQLLS